MRNQMAYGLYSWVFALWFHQPFRSRRWHLLAWLTGQTRALWRLTTEPR